MRFLLWIALALAFLIAVIGVLVARQYIRDPVAAIDRDLSDVVVVKDSAYVVHRGSSVRIYRDVELYASSMGTARFTLSLPDTILPGESLPVVPIIGGLEIGRESLDHVPDHGRNALLAYEYPYGPEYWYEGAEIGDLPGIRRAVLNVPAQVTAATLWALGQEWADRDRVNVFGYSFGAIFTPAYYRIAVFHGVDFHSGVMLYGGADIYRLLRHNLLLDHAWQRELFARASAIMLRPMEPELHAPHFDTEFLVVNGQRDQFVLPELGLRLQEATAEPKTTMMLDLPHMHPEATELNRHLICICLDWLVDRDAVNPIVIEARAERAGVGCGGVGCGGVELGRPAGSRVSGDVLVAVGKPPGERSDGGASIVACLRRAAHDPSVKRYGLTTAGRLRSAQHPATYPFSSPSAAISPPTRRQPR